MSSAPELPSTAPNAAPVVLLRDLRFRWAPDRPPVLDLPELRLERGEAVFLRGPSGSGKTTLLGVVGGVLHPEAGRVELLGTDLGRLGGAARDRFRADHVGFVFQLFNLFPHLTALENIVLAQRVVRQRKVKEAEEVAHHNLAKVGIGEKWDSYPSQLSGGQQQRVAIARALAMDPKIMLFDEPTSALDPEMIKGVLDVMLDLAQEGMTMVVVSHEMGFVRAAADRVALLDEGSIVEITTPERLFRAPEQERTKEFLSQILQH
jgi:ABC-type polar amino acid transport system ATPase subunit